MSMELKIEKMVYGGDGLARMPADGSGRSKTVFIPFVLTGEQVSATTVEQKTGFDRAEAGRIIAASPHRVEPECPYFYRCGGCHYQHSDYEHQLEIKRDILRETLKRTARIDFKGDIQTHASAPWNYRNRTRMHVRTPEFAIGYYKANSRKLLPVEVCPISSPLINRALKNVWKLGQAGLLPASTREIEFFANSEDTELLLEVYSTYEPESSTQHELLSFAEALAAALPEVKGTCAFATGSSLFPWDSAAWSYGETNIRYLTAFGSYRVQAGSFFQTNRFLADELVDIVAQGSTGLLAIDFYAGTGLFSVPLAKQFERVIAVESAPTSFADLQINAPANVQTERMTSEEYLRKNAATADLKPDLVVVDPPRTGLEEKVTAMLSKLAPRCITYVSCDPATLARDLRVLLDHGYAAEEVHLIDLFPQTYHLESVVKLKHQE
jgi:23S rRNA (uracil1939-C5)-methyltransferase